MAIKLVLSAEAIGNKVFRGVPRGYDPLEVDTYLDRIIADFEKVEKNCLLSKAEVEKMEKKISSLEQENQKLNIELNRLKNKYSGIDGKTNVNADNIDLVKRIADLERFLWANGFNPNKIK